MRIQTIQIINFQDFKDRDGLWVKSFSKNIDGVCYHYHTRSGKLWNAILRRTNSSGSIHKETQRYSGVKNNFSSYQYFADWCQNQDGYLNKEDNGNYWSLDKDLIQDKEVKEYSPETCIFIPAQINTMFGPHTKRRGKTPIGVTNAKGRGRFKATITTKEGRFSLGVYDTVMEAHSVWQRAKIDNIIKIANTLELTPKIKEIVLSKAYKMENELRLGIESVFK